MEAALQIEAPGMASSPSSATIERLREQIRKLQAAPREYLAALRTGVAQVDALFPEGGLPLGQAVELHGEAASGRTSLALRALAAATREERLVAYVDGPKELYAPAAEALGVDLSRMLVVQPRAPGQLVWTAVQLARSGAFACVVLDLTHTGVRLSLAEAKKLQEAAQKGGGLLLLLTPVNAPGDGVVRLSVQSRGEGGMAVEVLRSRKGGMGRVAELSWEDVYPEEAPVYRYASPQAFSALEDLPPAPSPFRRVKKHDARNGLVYVAGSRPGRDTAMGSLYEPLGVGGPH